MVTIEEGIYDVECRCKRCGKVFTAGKPIYLSGGPAELIEEERDNFRKMNLVIHECSPYKYGFANICGFTMRDI